MVVTVFQNPSMSIHESNVSNTSAGQGKRERGLLERISSLLLREPEDREQLLEVLQQAHERNLLDADALSMIEGVMQVGEMAARDIMIPRAQMDLINIEDSLDQVLAFAVEKTHSRFPVYEGQRDNVIGVLLTKDLLRCQQLADIQIRDILRPVIFIPESKRLNVLLTDFRQNRNHIAMVVDEFGGVSGLVTIEDVLEQIVGDIEDEYDGDEDADHILPLEGDLLGVYRVKATTDLLRFNEVFGTDFSNEQADTVGGLLSCHLSRLPYKGEVFQIGSIRFEVLRADARQVHLLNVQVLPAQVDGHMPIVSDSESSTSAANS